MEVIKSFGLIISLLMVLMAYIKQLIPDGKASGLMKMILAIFIMLSMIEGVRNFDLSKIQSVYEKSYNIDFWNETADLIENGLVDEMNSFLKEQDVSAEVLEVEREVEDENFKIIHIDLKGFDSEFAKNIIAGRYQIDRDNIEVKNE